MIGSLLSTLANAQKLSIEQLQKGIQDGTVDSYIAVPLIAQKTKQMKEATAILAGQKAQGQPPVGEQVMQDADQVTRPVSPLAPTAPGSDGQASPAPNQMAQAPQGIDSAQSNLPVQMAGGGIVAFEEGGPTRAAGYDDSQYVNSPDFGLGDTLSRFGDWATTPIGGPSASAVKRAATKRQLGKEAAEGRPSKSVAESPSMIDKAADWWHENAISPAKDLVSGGIRQLPNAPLEFGNAVPMPNAPLRSAEMSPLPNATLDETPYEMEDIRREAGKAKEAPKPLPKPEEIKTKEGELAIQRNVPTSEAAPQANPTQANPTQAPASASRDDDFDQYMQRMQAERDELKRTILGQKDSRAKDEKDNLSNALMKAGFGMMSARSPWAMTNIGEGATAGLDTYAKGIEQIKGNDDKVVQQLVSMGLKGQDLDNAAMKLGVDLRQQKMMEPYYATAAAENKAKMGLYPAQAKLYGAQAGLTGAQTEKQFADTNQTNVETALLPQKVANEGIRAAGAGAGRSGKTGVSDTYMKEAQKTRDAYLLDPSSSPHVGDDLKEALVKYKPGSKSYNDALKEARQQIKEQYYRDIGETGYYKGSGASSGSSEE